MFRSVFTKSLRAYRWAILGWGIGMAALLYVQYATIGTALNGASAQSLQQFVQQFRFFGETIHVNTPGGYVTFKTMGWLPVLLGVWTVLAGARMTRGEEESGSLDVLLSTPQSRLSVITQKALALAAATGVISVLMGFGLLLGMVGANAVAPDIHVTVSVSAAMLGALNAGVAAYMFGAMALLAAQFMSRAGAAGLAGGLMAALYVLDGTGRQVNSATGVRPFSLLYFYDRSLPLIPGHGMDWGALAFLVALCALLVVAAIPLFLRRDLGRSALADVRVASAPRHPRLAAAQTLARAWREVWSRGVGAQAFRRQAVAMFWWVVSLAIFAGYLVFIAKTTEKQMQNLLNNSSFLRQYLNGADLATNNGFLSTFVFGYLPVIMSVFVGLMAYRWATDLDKGRLELTLSTPISRWRVILERYTAVVVAAVAATFAIWLAMILFAQAAGFSLDLGRLTVATLGILPLTLVTSSLVYALAGVLPPGLVIGVMSAFLAASFVVDQLRTLLHLPTWALDLSIFHQYGSPVLNGLNWGGFFGMLTLAVALLALGVWQFSLRDLDRGAVQE